MKKLIVVFVVGFVVLTVIVAGLSARKGSQKPPLPPAAQNNRTLNLDAFPPQFPQR